jgi:hypothetical protein
VLEFVVSDATIAFADPSLAAETNAWPVVVTAIALLVSNASDASFRVTSIRPIAVALTADVAETVSSSVVSAAL